ncbi:MAG: hypothetical protein R3A46_19690 [Thermomicrobiales bacterium]
MKRILSRANLLIKWQRTEGDRRRAIWIDGATASKEHLERTRQDNADGSFRRII